MIIRIFKAKVKPGLRKEVENFFLYEAIPFLKVQEGLVDVTTGKPVDHDSNEYVMVTVWKDIDSVSRFMDNHWNTSKVLRGEGSYLEDSSVEHFEVMGQEKLVY